MQILQVTIAKCYISQQHIKWHQNTTQQILFSPITFSIALRRLSQSLRGTCTVLCIPRFHPHLHAPDPQSLNRLEALLLLVTTGTLHLATSHVAYLWQFAYSNVIMEQLLHPDGSFNDYLRLTS